jgi:hypothetical protein
VDTERFLKDKRCIIQIQNKDDMCCARVIVTAKVKIDGHEEWILLDKVVVSKKSWRWNYTPRREYPYINAESKM